MRGNWLPVLGGICTALLLSAIGARETGAFLVRSRAALALFVEGAEAAFGTGSRDQQNVHILRSFINQRGQQCQVLEQNIVIGGDKARATGTACRRWNGLWTMWHGTDIPRR